MTEQALDADRSGDSGIPRYEVVVVGGGPAGLSGALTLARARRTVLVVDSGEPRNARAQRVHPYLARDGLTPTEMRNAGVREVLGYGGEVTAGRVVAAEPLPARPAAPPGTDQPLEPAGFRILLDDGSAVAADRLLVATGLVDDLPAVPGLADRWGEDVLHCPYCHGWEVRDRRIAVLATGPQAVQQALLWRQWTARLTVLQHTAPAFADGAYEKLAARGVTVVPGTVTGTTTDDHGRLTGVRVHGADTVPCDALVVAPWAAPRAELCASLGLAPVAGDTVGGVAGSRVPADPDGATTVPGVWVAGNLAAPADQAVGASAAGVRAATAINADLVASETRRAVREHRGAAAAFWERNYQAHDALWSGEPNAVLVREAATLPAGHALDLGCGEGADALWLAEHGWRVTAVDVSRVALERAARHASAAGLAGRVDWRQRDLATGLPPGEYDLVCALYLHSPVAIPREAILREAAAAVTPGGTLLVVGHTGPPPWQDDAPSDRPPPEVPGLPSAGQVRDRLRLSPEEWRVEVDEEYDRPVTPPGTAGGGATRRDAVLRLTRRA